MDKIRVNELIFEITRKCNMVCDHCLRGCAQGLDMTEEIVNATFGNISEIGRVVFTGGEPVLNVDLIEYITNYIIENDIQVEGFYLVSNGKEVSTKLVIILMELYAHIYKYNNGYVEDFSQFQVSIDEFHEESSPLKYSIYHGLSFFSLRENNYSHGVIDMGLASENGLPSNPKTISNPEIDIYDGEIGSIEMIYINAKGGILTDCDLSYEVQEHHLYGNILTDSLYDVFIEYVEIENIA